MRLVSLRLAALLLVALAAALPARAQTPVAGDLVVSEIMFGPPTGGSEYVELYNRSSKSVEVADLRLNDNAGGAGRVITTTSTLLGPGQYLVLAQTLTAFQTTYPGVAALQPSGGWGTLNNSGTDASVLKHVSGVVIDSVAYTVPPAVVGRSYERIDADGPSTASNFAASTAAALGTPGAANSVVDTAPPTVTASSYDQAANTFSITFSEPVQTSTLTSGSLAYSGTTSYTIEPTGVSGATASGVVLRFASAPPPGAYTVTVQGVRDVKGNAMPTTPLPMNVAFTGDVAAPGDLIVNEIMAAPPTGGSEYVEVYNRSQKTFNLSDFRFNDNTGTPRVITTQPVTVAPGAYMVVVQNLTAFQTAYPGVTALQATSWPSLNNDADAAVLKYAASGGSLTVIDSVAYTSPPAPSGKSYERIDPTGPSVPSNFAASTDAALGTPGRQNSVFFIDTAAPVALNAEETALQTVVVTFNEPVEAATVAAARFSVGGVVPTSATRSDDGTKVTLVFAAPLSANTLAVAAGVRDLKGNTAVAVSLPVGRAAAPGDLVVNEIMANPLASSTDNLPDQPEYLELFNRSDKPISLSGLMIVGQPDETGKADTLRLAADGRTVPPGGFVVIYDADATDGANPATDSRLAKAFPNVTFAAASIVLLGPSTVTSGGLTNSGERLRVVLRGVTVDDVTYSATWYDPLRSRAGISLERIDPAGPSNAATNWTSSRAARGGTPGQPNSVAVLTGVGVAAANDVVVNEIMYAPRASSTDTLPDQPEYVEFYNRSAQAFNLNGWFLTGTPNERGEADTTRIAFAPTRLSAGGYLVVYRLSGVFGTSANPDSLFRLAFPATPSDAVLLGVSGLSLPNDGGTVKLYTSARVLLDAVTYSPRWHNASLREDTGVSLERRDPAAPSNEPTNWGSSPDALGGTPGRRNALTLDPTDPTLPASAGLTIEPSPFSPDGDGDEDFTLIRYRLSGDAASGSIRVRIYNVNGRLVRTLTAAQLAGPVGALDWDGKDDDGRGLALGPYIVLLDLVDAQGGTTQAYRKVVTLARKL